MIVLRYFQIPDSSESQEVLAAWTNAMKSRRQIAKVEIEPAVSFLAYELWGRVFHSSGQSALYLVGSQGLTRPHEGLKAWASFVGRGVLHETNEYPSEPGIEFDHLLRCMLIFARDEFGDYPRTLGAETIRDEWHRDQKFLQRWIRLKGAGAHKPRTSQRYALAFGWDHELIPVRYFSNEGAADWVKFMIKGGGGEEECFGKVDTYEKDIRGDRGLKLSQDANHPPIVTAWTKDQVFIDRKSAETHGLILFPADRYAKNWGGREIRFT